MVSTISRQDQNNKDDLNQPSKEGRFGKYGGQYVPETLMPALFELEEAAKVDTFNKRSKINISKQKKGKKGKTITSVSYTHLTLPTIYSV